MQYDMHSGLIGVEKNSFEYLFVYLNVHMPLKQMLRHTSVFINVNNYVNRCISKLGHIGQTLYRIIGVVIYPIHKSFVIDTIIQNASILYSFEVK